MDLRLTFKGGLLTGDGRDWVGKFSVRGRYSTADGRCHWTKQYAGKHDVSYQGYNEGKGIWGVWEITAAEDRFGQRGGFHIWPEGMPDPSRPQLREQADLPITISEELEVSEPLVVPAK